MDPSLKDSDQLMEVDNMEYTSPKVDHICYHDRSL